jgi:hypothetical protein
MQSSIFLISSLNTLEGCSINLNFKFICNPFFEILCIFNVRCPTRPSMQHFLATIPLLLLYTNLFISSFHHNFIIFLNIFLTIDVIILHKHVKIVGKTFNFLPFTNARDHSLNSLHLLNIPQAIALCLLV